LYRDPEPKHQLADDLDQEPYPKHQGDDDLDRYLHPKHQGAEDLYQDPDPELQGAEDSDLGIDLKHHGAEDSDRDHDSKHQGGKDEDEDHDPKHQGARDTDQDPETNHQVGYVVPVSTPFRAFWWSHRLFVACLAFVPREWLEARSSSGLLVVKVYELCLACYGCLLAACAGTLTRSSLFNCCATRPCLSCAYGGFPVLHT
jgi:hypothetical protein